LTYGIIHDALKQICDKNLKRSHNFGAIGIFEIDEIKQKIVKLSGYFSAVMSNSAMLGWRYGAIFRQYMAPPFNEV
jgi:hypothetical protein